MTHFGWVKSVFRWNHSRSSKNHFRQGTFTNPFLRRTNNISDLGISRMVINVPFIRHKPYINSQGVHIPTWMHSHFFILDDDVFKENIIYGNSTHHQCFLWCYLYVNWHWVLSWWYFHVWLWWPNLTLRDIPTDDNHGLCLTDFSHGWRV